eukprot:Skav200685  [mRNA]  locus=scaffold1446:290210:295882:+ [translate_table: standard]
MLTLLLGGLQLVTQQGCAAFGEVNHFYVENYESFLNLPLDFQGFCVQSLVGRKGLLVPGNPALGVVRRGSTVELACYRQPELIHLLRVHEAGQNRPSEGERPGDGRQSKLSSQQKTL